MNKPEPSAFKGVLYDRKPKHITITLTEDQLNLLQTTLYGYSEHWYGFHNNTQRAFIKRLQTLLAKAKS